MRIELLILGVILIALGVGLIIGGYQTSRPTLQDSAVGFLESISGTKAPANLKSSKTESYIFYGAGVLSIVGGIISILKCRGTD